MHTVDHKCGTTDGLRSNSPAVSELRSEQEPPHTLFHRSPGQTGYVRVTATWTDASLPALITASITFPAPTVSFTPKVSWTDEVTNPLPVAAGRGADPSQ
jgi:hypothetical protein